MAIEWKTYRSRSQSPAPVAEVRVERNYELRHRIDPDETLFRVGDYEEARAIYSGKRWTNDNRVPSTVLGEEPVLIKPKNRKNLLTEWVWAAPQFPSDTRYTHYDQPSLDAKEETLIVPHSRNRAPMDNPTRRPGKYRTEGVYTIDPGFRNLRGVLVNGKASFSAYDYDPVHGAVYIEQSKGTPIDDRAPVEVFTDREGSMRHGLRRLGEGVHPVTYGSRNEVVSEVVIGETEILEDNRRLPVPKDDERWHAIDYAQYDGRPIPSGSLWVIRTEDVPREEIEAAVGRVMPAGVLYRTERVFGFDTQLDFTDEENSGYASLI